ncbi:Bifunctional non-homologous end joining protein LigD [Sutcliffiella rhizosphaerae]|uniref:DNA ligase (ATP) n=2 Tax=Sutcliffiella rhizosphaerae TaxID=2880967 RepID=A0ABN8A600_9BACI|nr:Bifunctional non-homologous end joining protein LigD [Sutcliffiella rhizosphaerae]
MKKPMLSQQYSYPPTGDEWIYEVKYDGFRCIVSIDQNKIEMQSRNGKPLHSSFPEVFDFLHYLKNVHSIKNKLPLTLDGELAVLTSPYKADFASIQKRGRIKENEKIHTLAKTAPATLLAFDLLELKGRNVTHLPLVERKQILQQLFSQADLPLQPLVESSARVHLVSFTEDNNYLWEKVQNSHGEGIVSKRKKSVYELGRRSSDWIKVKNFKTATCFITAFDKKNGFFHIGVYIKENEIEDIGLFSHGISSEERSALLTVMRENSLNEDTQFLYVAPGICIDVLFLELYQNKLRHPEFKKFRFDVDVKQCTLSNVILQELPPKVSITNPKKTLWNKPLVMKQDYLRYLASCAPFLLPFIQDRLLTVIRFPHGVDGESFYQKNCPDYAPSFVKKYVHDDTEHILCNNLDTLIWLGNQLALEFHIPFQTVYSNTPDEIVFDLDPPAREFFSNAVKGAIMMKEIFDQLHLTSFVKTSGRKGLQIYIPLPEKQFSYDDTRIFTEFIASYLVSKEPSLFTVERLKKNRGNKVYIDFMQHGEGKTIIAPYSLRGNDLPTVATPLLWEEVKEDLSPDKYTIFSVIERIKHVKDPFQQYNNCKINQPFKEVLSYLKKQNT